MKKYLSISLCSLLFVASCSPALAPKIGFKSVAQDNKIIYIRHDGQVVTLKRYLKVVKNLSKIDENGLFVGILVVNNDRYRIKSNPNLVCDVQFVFLDESGLEVEKTNWQPYIFPPGVNTTVKQVSMNQNSRDYKVYIREPKSGR